jgi:hypothetical protein
VTTGASVVFLDCRFEIVAGTRDDTGEPTVVLYLELPDDERTTFGCALSPEAAAMLADTLAEAAGVPMWPALGLS